MNSLKVKATIDLDAPAPPEARGVLTETVGVLRARMESVDATWMHTYDLWEPCKPPGLTRKMRALTGSFSRMRNRVAEIEELLADAVISQRHYQNAIQASGIELKTSRDIEAQDQW